jgi:serine/threonine-protein kinase
MTKTVGRYQILEKVGQGGMGTVYKAFDPLLERTVAVKVIATQFEGNPHLRERFFREARAAGHLSHKNIIVIHDLGEQDGQPFLAMEFLEGTNLDARMRSVGRMRLDRTLQVIGEVCDGLEYAHGHGVIHRDIKPANIFITDSGHVKLLDFGLARLVSSELTRSNTMIGTVNYMAPEQIRGEKVDHRADIFSAGVVVYELLTGKKAFEGDSFATTIYKILQEIPEPPQRIDPSIPASIVEIVDRAMAKARDERYQTIGEMLRDVMLAREALKGSDPTAVVPRGVAQRPPSDPARPVDSPIPVAIAAGPGTPPPASGPPVGASGSWRRSAAASIAGAAVVAALGGALWLARGGPPVVADPVSAPAAPALAAPADARVPDVSTRGSPDASRDQRRDAEQPTATEGARRTRDASPPPAPGAAPSRRERAGREESPASAQPSAGQPAPLRDQQSADEAQAQMVRSKAAAEAAGAQALAPTLYDAASAAERDARDRYQSAQFGQAAARFYESAGLFRSAETAAKNERAAREERAEAASRSPARQPVDPRAADAPRPEAAAARAEEPAPPQEGLVREAVNRYVAALEARSIEDLKRIWPAMTAAQQRAMHSEFANARTIRVGLVEPQIQIAADTAKVTALRRYELLTSDGRRLQTDTRTTILLRRSGGSWLIEDIRHQTAR